MITVDQLPAKLRANVRIEQIDGCPVPGPCWVWTAGKTAAGYGLSYISRRERPYVHRLSYSLLVGTIPDGLQIDHRCRNRACCNPDHLEAVTAHVNTLRGEKATKTHCVNDHPLTGANLIWNNNGPNRPRTRRCRTCSLASNRRKWARNSDRYNARRRAARKQVAA